MIWNDTMELSYMVVGISSIVFLILILVIAFIDGRLCQRMKFINILLNHSKQKDLIILEKDMKIKFYKMEIEKLITKLKKHEKENDYVC